MIQETTNPFDVNLDPDKLYIIGTGLAAVESTQNFLLNVFKNGENEQNLAKVWFEKPITIIIAVIIIIIIIIIRLDGLKNLSKGKKWSHLLQELGSRK